MIVDINLASRSLPDAAAPSQRTLLTDIPISHSPSGLPESRSDLIKALLAALVPELSSNTDKQTRHATPLLEHIETIFHQYPGDVKADFGILPTSPIPLIQISPPTLNDDDDDDDDDDVTAIKVELNSHHETLDKQLRQFAAWRRDEALRSNANYHSVLPKIRAADENKTGFDGSPWASVEDSIKNIKENYLTFFSSLMNEYTEMYRMFNDLVQKTASNALGEGKDGNAVKFDNKKMQDAYNDFKKYIDKNPLKSISGWEQMSKEQKLAMAENLKPAFNVDVDKDGNGTGKVEFNLSQFDELMKNIPVPDKDKNEVPIYKYQAWLSYFTAVGSAFQNNMNSFAQRYKQANDTANNLNNVLSGSINTWGEILKGMIQAWR